jgi:hypothetical protein
MSVILTVEQHELAAAHGTPEEFSRALWNAYGDLWISSDEARAAIAKYRQEWKKAGEI